MKEKGDRRESREVRQVNDTTTVTTLVGGAFTHIHSSHMGFYDLIQTFHSASNTLHCIAFISSSVNQIHQTRREKENEQPKPNCPSTLHLHSTIHSISSPHTSLNSHLYRPKTLDSYVITTPDGVTSPLHHHAKSIYEYGLRIRTLPFEGLIFQARGRDRNGRCRYR